MAVNDSQPVVTAGPTINGQETVIAMYSPTQLKSYPYLTQLCDLINEGFGRTCQPWFPSGWTRFDHPEDVYWELVPEFFTYIISSKKLNEAGEPELYATVSARTVVPQEKHSRPGYEEFKRSAKGYPEGTVLWELKLLVVGGGLAGQGIASMLQNLVETEIKKRAQLTKLADAVGDTNFRAQVDGSQAAPRELRILLSTCAEINENYYLRRGYRTTHKKAFEAGFGGSNLPFHMAEMEKVVEM